jgi:uncharacterized membrane protein (DUF485 family)
MMMQQYTNAKVDLLFRAKLQLGIRLLLCFFSVYAIFVSLHVFKPHWLSAPVVGVSLGLVLSVGLIISTVVMALAFHLLSCRIERTFADQLLQTVTPEKQ